jgi:geranylgeranyl pyrophosphate synthase
LDKSRYFELMRETSEVVFPLIAARIDAMKAVDPGLHPIVRYIVDKRDTSLLLRPFLIRLTYEMCGGVDWRVTAPVGAAFELVNISSYQANSAFDNKHQVLSPGQKNSQFIAAMLTRELASDIVTNARASLTDSVVEALLRDLSTCNKNIYFAQHLDMNELVVANHDRYRDEDEFLAAYTKRCYLGCGLFTGLCARAGGLLAGANSDDLEALCRFGEEFGTALQIINDLGDFVPPDSGLAVDRGYQDQYCDLRNGRLTLGCYKLFNECGAFGRLIERRQSSGEDIDDADCRRIAEMMVRAGSIESILKLSARNELTARALLNAFPDGTARQFLLQMLTLCHANKFTEAFKAMAVKP